MFYNHQVKRKKNYLIVEHETIYTNIYIYIYIYIYAYIYNIIYICLYIYIIYIPTLYTVFKMSHRKIK